MAPLQRPLVTGAAGFIGYHLCEYLNSLDEVEEIIAFDIPNSKNTELLKQLSKVKLMAQVLDFESGEVVRDLHPTSAFALAALNGTSRFYSEPFEVLMHSTIPTLALLANLDADCPFLYSSSSEVYASNLKLGISQVPTPEVIQVSLDDISNPRWSYAAAKIHGEVATIASSIEKGRKSSIVRYHNVYGPHMGLDHFIPDFISRVIKGQYWIENPKSTRSFLNVRDAVIGTVRALLRASESTPIFHLGNTCEMTIEEAAKSILRIMKKEQVPLAFRKGPKGSVSRRVPDVRKAKEVLEWEARVTFEEGIREMLESLDFNV